MASEPSEIDDIQLTGNKKVYFASDFHLGAPDWEQSRTREKKITQWLDLVSQDAEAIFLVGDIFDFWFEHKHTIPKGFIRFQGKLAELRDYGISIIFFTGNHDMWMFEYFPQELDIPIFRKPTSFNVNDQRIMVGHGDGLGSGDHFYKVLKKIFAHQFFQWIFHRIHPNLGISIAKYWSSKSRLTHKKKEEDKREVEWLLQHCKQIECNTHHDLYIFGHRHIPLNLKVSENSRYINLGEWIHHYTYLEIDNNSVILKSFS